MKYLRFYDRTLKAIAVLGIAVALTACASAPTTGAPANAASAGSAQTPSANRARQGAPGVTGDVVSVNGNTFSVQIPNQSGPYTTVSLTGNTQILKQAAGTLASVPTGASISATGKDENGVFTATQVRVLGQAGQGDNRQGGPQASGTPRAGGFGQGRGANGQGSPQANGTPRAGRTGDTAGLGGNLFGTVEQVSADGLTVKGFDGTTTQLRLAPNAQVTVEEAGTASDITPGARVFVVGDEQNGNLTATRVQIVPAAQGQ